MGGFNRQPMEARYGKLDLMITLGLLSKHGNPNDYERMDKAAGIYAGCYSIALNRVQFNGEGGELIENARR